MMDAIEAFLAERGNVSERDAVLAKLGSSSTFIASPSNYVDAQVNRILEVRSVLRAYDRVVEQQISRLPELQKGS